MGQSEADPFKLRKSELTDYFCWLSEAKDSSQQVLLKPQRCVTPHKCIVSFLHLEQGLRNQPRALHSIQSSLLTPRDKLIKNKTYQIVFFFLKLSERNNYIVNN